MCPVGDYSFSEAWEKSTALCDWGCLKAAMDAQKLAEIRHKCALFGDFKILQDTVRKILKYPNQSIKCLSEAWGKNRQSVVSDYLCLEAAMKAQKLAETRLIYYYVTAN